MITERFLLGAETAQTSIAVTGGLNALADPSAHGYPDATNTGITRVGLTPDDLTATGTLLVNDANVTDNGVIRVTRPSTGTAVWGPVTLTPDRTVIYRADVTGRVRQQSSHYLDIDQSRIVDDQHDAGVATVDSGGKKNWNTTRVTVTDCQLYGGSREHVFYQGLITVRRCDISGGKDNVRLGSFDIYSDCYLHDPVRVTGSHNDSFQAIWTSDNLIEHCTIVCAVPTAAGVGVEFPDGWYDPMNAVGMIGNENGPTSNIIFNDCLVDGGNYTFNSNWNNQVNRAENITVSSCRFGRHFRYGPKATPDANTDPNPPTWIWTGNVWDDTGAPV
jgi:hypothetical protein